MKRSSCTSYPLFADWLQHFLFTSLCRAWALLDDGGHLALSIGDTYQLLQQGHAYTEATVLFITCHLLGAVNQGMMAFAGAKAHKPRPIWIFKKELKVQEESLAKQRLAREMLAKYYPVHYKAMLDHQKSIACFC